MSYKVIMASFAVAQSTDLCVSEAVDIPCVKLHRWALSSTRVAENGREELRQFLPGLSMVW